MKSSQPSNEKSSWSFDFFTDPRAHKRREQEYVVGSLRGGLEAWKKEGEGKKMMNGAMDSEKMKMAFRERNKLVLHFLRAAALTDI